MAQIRDGLKECVWGTRGISSRALWTGHALTDEKAKHFENPPKVFQLLERYLTVSIALSAAHLQ